MTPVIKVSIQLNSFREFKEILEEIKKVKDDNPHMEFEFHVEVAGN